MSNLPMAVYGLEVPAGDVAIPARVDIPAAFRITMAAIDPSAEPEESGTSTSAKPRATLKIIRQALLAGYDSEDDESDFDEDDMNALLAGGASDSDEDSDAAETNGGPSDPAKSKKARKAAAEAQIMKELQDQMEVDQPNGVKSKGKGKGKALAVAVEEDEEEDDEDDEDDSDDSDEDEAEEFVICTLDPERTYQQPLDITIGEDEVVFFKVSGTHSIFLTGNYVEPSDPHPSRYDDYDSEDEDDYDEEDFDLTPDEDELADEDDLSGDDLDDMEDPRITELADDDEDAPALIPAAKKGKEAKAKDVKGKNKRPADDSEEPATLDEMITKAQPNGDAKLSKKQAKKLKNNEGKAVAADKEDPSPAKSDKKVSFAEKLETGPTPSPAAKDKAATGPRVVQGVTIDVKKVGEGEEAKKGDRVGMRYIGKTQKDNKQFDSNKKGKPFTFKLGIGEVIKGWDVGVAGMRVGGERRLTVPAHLGYGSKGAPGIPANSTLVFDIKCVEISKKS